MKMAKAAALLQHRSTLLLTPRRTAGLPLVLVGVLIRIVHHRGIRRVLNHILLRKAVIVCFVVLFLFLWSWRRVMHHVWLILAFIYEWVWFTFKIFMISWEVGVFWWQFSRKVIMKAVISLKVLLILVVGIGPFHWSTWLHWTLLMKCLAVAAWINSLKRPISNWLLIILIFLLILLNIKFIVLTKFLLRRRIFSVASMRLLLIASRFMLSLMWRRIGISLLLVAWRCVRIVLLSSVLMEGIGLLAKMIGLEGRLILIILVRVRVVNSMASWATSLWTCVLVVMVLRASRSIEMRIVVVASLWMVITWWFGVVGTISIMPRSVRQLLVVIGLILKWSLIVHLLLLLVSFVTSHSIWFNFI